MKGLDVNSSVVNGLVVSESIVRESVGEYRSQARSYRLAGVRDSVLRLGREDSVADFADKNLCHGLDQA